MSFLDRTLSGLAGGKALVVLSLLTLIVLLPLYYFIFQIDSGILDMGFGHSSDSVGAILGAYSPEDFKTYGMVQKLDMVFPALYGLLITGLLYKFWQGSAVRFLAPLGLLAGLFDYIENPKLAKITAQFPQLDADLITQTSTISQLKFTVLGLALLLVIAGWLYARTQKRKQG